MLGFIIATVMRCYLFIIYVIYSIFLTVILYYYLVTLDFILFNSIENICFIDLFSGSVFCHDTSFDLYSSVRDGGDDDSCKSVLGPRTKVSENLKHALFQIDVIQSGGFIKNLREEVIRREFISGPIFDPEIIGYKYFGLFGAKYAVIETPSKEALLANFELANIKVPSTFFRPVCVEEFNEVLFYSGFTKGFDAFVVEQAEQIFDDFKNDLLDKSLIGSSLEAKVSFQYILDFPRRFKLYLALLKFAYYFESTLKDRLFSSYKSMCFDLIVKLYSFSSLSEKDKVIIVTGDSIFNFNKLRDEIINDSNPSFQRYSSINPTFMGSTYSRSFNKVFTNNTIYREIFYRLIDVPGEFKKSIYSKPYFSDFKGYPEPRVPYISVIKLVFIKDYPHYKKEVLPAILERILSTETFYRKCVVDADYKSKYLEYSPENPYYQKVGSELLKKSPKDPKF